MRFPDAGWHELRTTLDERPYLSAQFNLDVHRRLVLGFGGYLVHDECFGEGAHFRGQGNRLMPTPECITRHQELCGGNYLLEALPEQPGCLLTGRWTTVGFPVSSVMDLNDVGFSRKELAEQGFTEAEASTLQLFVVRILENPRVSIDDIRGLAGAPVLQTLKDLDADSLDSFVDTLGSVGLSRALSTLDGLSISHRDLAEQGFTADEVPTVQALVLEMTARGLEVSDEEVGKLAGAPLLETLRSLGSDGLSNLFRAIGYLRDKDVLSVILDPARTFVEQREITLPLAGEVTLSVIWPYRLPSRSVESQAIRLLEQAIRHHEGLMGVRFPLDYLVLILADPSPYGGFSTRGVVVAYHTDNRDVIAHEVAHAYVIGGPGWIIEGVPTFLDVVSRRPLNGAPIIHPDLPCRLFDTLAELDRSDLSAAAIHESRCTYHLGLAIFQELYNRLGYEAFRQGLASLYLNAQDDSDVPACTGINGEPAPDTDRGFCQMTAAFVDGLPPEKAAIAEEIIFRRYYGVSP